MLAYGESETAERGRNRQMRWQRGELSGHDLAREPVGQQRDHRLGEMPLPVRPMPLIGAKNSPTATTPPKKTRMSEMEIQTS